MYYQTPFSSIISIPISSEKKKEWDFKMKFQMLC